MNITLGGRVCGTRGTHGRHEGRKVSSSGDNFCRKNSGKKLWLDGFHPIGIVLSSTVERLARRLVLLEISLSVEDEQLRKLY